MGVERRGWGVEGCKPAQSDGLSATAAVCKALRFARNAYTPLVGDLQSLGAPPMGSRIPILGILHAIGFDCHSSQSVELTIDD